LPVLLRSHHDWLRIVCGATACSAHALAFIAEPSAICSKCLDNKPFIWRHFLPDIEKCGDRESIGLQPLPEDFNEHDT
jgi:hypothetical protein